MRISDWSSDVCSSDLGQQPASEANCCQWHARQRRIRVHRQLSWSQVCPVRLACNWQRRQLGGGAQACSGPRHRTLSLWKHQLSNGTQHRSEERRVGKECVSKFRSWWCQFHLKKNNNKNN